MKAMTCQDLGGPRGFAHQGSTADEIIKAQDRHVREMVANGDQTHTGACDEMKARWRHPVANMGWYRAVKREFAARPEGRADAGADSGFGSL